MRVRLAAAALGLSAAVGLALAVATTGCRQPERPTPTVPPRPVNPTNGPLAYQPVDVIDASIVTDAGRSLEAAIESLDVTP